MLRRQSTRSVRRSMAIVVSLGLLASLLGVSRATPASAQSTSVAVNVDFTRLTGAVVGPKTYGINAFKAFELDAVANDTYREHVRASGYRSVRYHRADVMTDSLTKAGWIINPTTQTRILRQDGRRRRFPRTDPLRPETLTLQGMAKTQAQIFDIGAWGLRVRETTVASLISGGVTLPKDSVTMIVLFGEGQ